MHDIVLNALAGLVLGAIAGSFAATLLVRWPQGRRLGGRSRCDGCAAPLAPLELVPVLSFAAQRGRCRRCRAAIDRRHLGVELAAALIGAAAFAAHGPLIGAATALFGWWLLLLAWLDAEHHWLPDALTLPLVPLGLAVALLGLGVPPLDRIIGAAAGGGALWAIAFAYRRLRGREGLGGGDPKLLAGIGAWLGWMQIPFVLLAASALGLSAAAVGALRGRQVTRTTALPFGTLLALAAWPLWLLAVRP